MCWMFMVKFGGGDRVGVFLEVDGLVWEGDLVGVGESWG